MSDALQENIEDVKLITYLDPFYCLEAYIFKLNVVSSYFSQSIILSLLISLSRLQIRST